MIPGPHIANRRMNANANVWRLNCGGAKQLSSAHQQKYFIIINMEIIILRLFLQ